MPAATAPAHDYMACTDAKCGSHLCIACQAGYDLGYQDGYRAGAVDGYRDGYADGLHAGAKEAGK